LQDGKIEAPSENIAVETLQGKGYVVLSLHSAKGDLFSADLSQFFARASNKDVVIFTRQLATLIDAGMPLAEGLRTLAKQVTNTVFRKIISSVSDAVEGGSSLSGALAEYPDLFSSFYVKLVRSGELSGKLQDSLTYLADHLEHSQDINSKIRGALAYPAFVMFAMLVVTVIMAVYVLPNLLGIFKESGIKDLPLSTKLLIAFTDYFNRYLTVIIFMTIVGGVSFWRYVKTPGGRNWVDAIKIQVPVFGRILKNLYLARMAESLATLIKSDIAILDVIKITSDIAGNVVYQRILLDAEESVRGGGSMSEVFAQYREIPPLMTSMISIGERTGKLEFMLSHVSKFYRGESEADIQNISQLIEPVLVFVLGIGVAVLVSSILLPIYSLVGAQ